jgi:hypothetical protein
MLEKSRIAYFAVTALSTAAFAASAGAACSDSRPGTPTAATATPTSTSAITVAWTNTARIGEYGGYIFIDISARRDGYPNDASLDKVSMRYPAPPGTRSSAEYTGLNPGVRYCFAVWSRKTANGCRSAGSSNWACAATLAAGAPPPPPDKPPPKALGKVIIFYVTPEPNNVFRVVGKNFLRDRAVTIRVANAALQNLFITHIGTSRITSDARGGIDVKLSGLCKQPGALYFSANDGRKNSKDLTGTLWSGTQTVTCR